MTLDDLRWLLSPEGASLLTAASAMDLGDAARLRTLGHLRRLTTPPRAAAAYDLALVRRRAAAKFARGAELFATREALEQASSEPLARHRAARFVGRGRVVDLGCGIGGDTLALAAVTDVIGVDRDPLRLAMARQNARIYGVGARAAWVGADISEGGPVRADAAFVDPSRRDAQGTRIFAAAQYDPPLPEVLRWRARFPTLAIKVAPGIADSDLAGFEGEAEFVSDGGNLKEAVLWCGAVAGIGRRATVLPSGATLHAVMDPPAPRQPIGRLLYEPDAAVIRAHLIGALAAHLGAWQIDPSIAYLSADAYAPSPFARAWRVERVLPFGVDRVRRYLRAEGVGRVIVKKRGSPLEPEAFARMLHLRGEHERTVLLTRERGQPVAIIARECGRVEPG